jgi:hypothetical protein
MVALGFSPGVRKSQKAAHQQHSLKNKAFLRRLFSFDVTLAAMGN